MSTQDEAPGGGNVESKTDNSNDLTIVDVAGSVDVKTISFTKSFTVTWKDEETGAVQVGTFTARRPGIGALGQIAVIKAKLNGGQNVDVISDEIHQMLAELQVILTDYPKWWTPDDFFSTTPLVKVASHVRSWLDSFRHGSVR